jgi:hypothetical protein
MIHKHAGPGGKAYSDRSFEMVRVATLLLFTAFMVRLTPLRPLLLLAQIDSFQDTIRYYMYKYAENKALVLIYAAGCLILVALIYQLLAKRK